MIYCTQRDIKSRAIHTTMCDLVHSTSYGKRLLLTKSEDDKKKKKKKKKKQRAYPPRGGGERAEKET
jgi:hypothetical protein